MRAGLQIQESAIQRKTVAQQQAEEPEEQDNEDGIAGEASATTSVTHGAARCAVEVSRYKHSGASRWCQCLTAHPLA